VPYCHVVFTIPDQLAPLALQNQRVCYSLLFPAVSETLQANRRRYSASGSEDRLSGGAAHLEPEPAAEPSLMMPGIIISFIFSEQGRLVVHATPSQN
jgi:hypothetical protein